jgi:hypothetical protein
MVSHIITLQASKEMPANSKSFAVKITYKKLKNSV